MHVPGLLSVKTLVVKLVSAAFVLAAGLIAEGEAPFVHIGAIVGGGIASGGSRYKQSMKYCYRLGLARQTLTIVLSYFCDLPMQSRIELLLNPARMIKPAKVRTSL